jgi:hypothetical protein
MGQIIVFDSIDEFCTKMNLLIETTYPYLPTTQIEAPIAEAKP